MRERKAMLRGILTTLVVGTLTVGVAGCTGGAGTPSPTVSLGTPSAGTPSAIAPAGFTVYSGDGFSLAAPSQWTDIPAANRNYPEAALEIGIRFTGQPTLQPGLAVWVDRTADLGTATSQAQLAQVQIRSQIPDAKITPVQPTQVSGAVSAVWFEYSYHMDATESKLNTTIEAGDYRVRDLTVQVDGKPQFGLRYHASAKDFSDEVWKQIVASMVVRADS